MKKYIQIVKIGISNSLIYRFDAIGSAIFSVLKILLSFILWSIIYRQNNIVGGYSFSMMMTYVILSDFIGRFECSNDIAQGLSNEIRGGSFTKYLLRPISVLGYYLSTVFSSLIFSASMNIIALSIWMLFFSRFIIFSFSIAIWGHMLLFTVLSLIFSALLNYLLMLLAFWILDVTAFYMIKNIVIQFITGALVPLSLFPNAFVSVFKYTPFYYTLYYPVSIYLTNDLSEVKLGLAVLVISIITVFILIRLIYRRAYNYYEGVGM